MKLKNFPDMIVFDEFPNRYNNQQRIVLTNLLHLERQVLPKKLCPIITTEHIAKQFKNYCKVKGAVCLLNSLEIIDVKPDNYTDIVLGGRYTLQMFFCESKEATRNLMVLIRECGRLKAIYTGNFLDIRTAILNDTVVSYIEHDAVPQLYLNLKRCSENPHIQEVELIFKIFDVIEKILNCHSNLIIHMYLPPYGYNEFIIKFVSRFRKRVLISNEFKYYQNPIIDNEILALLCDTVEKSKIILFPGKPSPRTLKEKQQVTVYIKDDSYKSMKDLEVSSSRFFYVLYYSPEPSPFQLQLLCLMLKPKRLFGIIDAFNTNYKVPSYLLELCSPTSPTVARHKRESRFSKTLKSLAEVKEGGKVLTFGPKTTNPTEKQELYYDDSESD